MSKNILVAINTKSAEPIPTSYENLFKVVNAHSSYRNFQKKVCHWINMG